MYERFTDRARKVMQLANRQAKRLKHEYIGTEHILLELAMEEARNLRHNYVGTEHLLLGLIREEEGVAAQVLMNLGLKLDDVRNEIRKLLGTGATSDGRVTSDDSGPSAARRFGRWLRNWFIAAR